MQIIEYNRARAVEYAKRWAFSRNPKYFNFDGIGGDCTNFASQCLFAGSGIMNETPIFGWFYRSSSDRTASWTGVEYFYRFLTGNKEGIGDGAGPFAEETSIENLRVGDFVQLGRETGDFYHTPVVVGFSSDGTPLVSAHSFDAYLRPLTTYSFSRLRCLHVLGVRKK